VHAKSESPPGLTVIPKTLTEPVNVGRRDRIRLLKGLICVLPFAVFYWLLPFGGTLTIANDYPEHSIRQQMELQYSLAHGTFPLYAPGFAGGRGAAALTLGQMYHPLSHLAAHSIGYWKGYALEWNTFWRLVSLGLVQLVLFNLLRRLKLSTDFAFILSFLTVYNQRMLDMFRYGASLENYTGFLLLCAALANLYITPDRFIRSLAVIGATYLLICGGHPQIAYLGCAGAALIALVIPYAVAALRPELAVNWRRTLRYYAAAGTYVGLGQLLALAYTLPFFVEFLRDAPKRVDQSYEWSLALSDQWGGAANSFFNPLRSDVHGAFGSSPLILVAILTPVVTAPLRQVKARAIMIALWLPLVVIFLCSLGDETPIHYWFWRLLPLADSFRVPGRIAMLLLPILMLIVGWYFRAADDGLLRQQMHPIAPWQISLMALAVFCGGYFLLAHPSTGQFTPFNIQHYPAWVNRVIFLSGFAALLLLTLRVLHWRARVLAGLLLSVVVVLQAAVQLRYGTWVGKRNPTRSLETMNDEKQTSLAFRGDAGYGMESGTLIDPYAAFAVFSPAENTSPSESAGVALPGQIGPATHIAARYSSFNRLVLRVDARTAGLLALAVPYSPQWSASVESREYGVRRTEDNELAVFLPAGSHDVEFRYHSPASVAGMLISCGTGLFVALFFLRRCRPGWLRIPLMVAAIVVLAGGFALWKYSLYRGDNLGLEYSWTSGP
jgi:hypothetical protein